MPANSNTRRALDEIFADWDTPDTPGMTVGVVRGGEPIYTRCMGLANAEHGVPNTTSTVFDIASMTKQFTAFAVLLLVRDGRFSFDDDVRQFLPELPGYDPPVRIRHCLYHTGGLTDWVIALDLTGPFSDYCSFKRASRTIIAMHDTMFRAGEDHSYSNTGYMLLAWIVARVTGTTLADFLQVRVFGPLGMSRSSFRTYPEELIPNEAQGHAWDGDGRLCHLPASCGVYGDGGMRASITDMVLWLQNFTRKSVGDAELIDQWFAPGRLDTGQPLRYAAGWELDRYRGFRVIRHGGMGVGFQSHIAWFPDVHIGVAILANIRPCWPWPLANKVLEALVDVPSIPKRPDPVTRERPADREDILGRYFTATGLPVSVDWNRGRFILDAWYSREPFERISTDVLFHPDFHDTLTFHRDESGRVTHFILQTDDGACARMHGPIRRAVKYEDAVLETPKLAEYEGCYLSDELQTLYTLEAEAEGLRARHLRCDDWRLRPIRSCLAHTFEDEFAQSGDWPGKVIFERRSGDKISGFRVRGSGHNLFFRKL